MRDGSDLVALRTSAPRVNVASEGPPWKPSPAAWRATSCPLSLSREDPATRREEEEPRALEDSPHAGHPCKGAVARERVGADVDLAEDAHLYKSLQRALG